MMSQHQTLKLWTKALACLPRLPRLPRLPGLRLDTVAWGATIAPPWPSALARLHSMAAEALRSSVVAYTKAMSGCVWQMGYEILKEMAQVS